MGIPCVNQKGVCLSDSAASIIVCKNFKEGSCLRSSWNTDPFFLCYDSKDVEFDGQGCLKMADLFDPGSDLSKEPLA